jgi:hypothetical protein
MNIKSGPVQIVGSGKQFAVTVHQFVNKVGSLGVFDSIEEAVSEVLKMPDIVPNVRTSLEAIQLKGIEVGWDEAQLSAFFPR